MPSPIIGECVVSSQSILWSFSPADSPLAQLPPLSTITRVHFFVPGLNVVNDSKWNGSLPILESNVPCSHQLFTSSLIVIVPVVSTIFWLRSMPWPLQCQVPAIALARVASSAGGPVSCPPPALASPGLGASVLGCATPRPVIPTSAMATRENVLICHAPGEKTARTNRRCEIVTSAR